MYGERDSDSTEYHSDEYVRLIGMIRRPLCLTVDSSYVRLIGMNKGSVAFWD